ncbi:hypothetical protein ABZ070_06895 [Streptomyces sp. NPDC006283]
MLLTGRSWSGSALVRTVELSTDNSQGYLFDAVVRHPVTVV